MSGLEGAIKKYSYCLIARSGGLTPIFGFLLSLERFTGCRIAFYADDCSPCKAFAIFRFSFEYRRHDTPIFRLGIWRLEDLDRLVFSTPFMHRAIKSGQKKS